MFLLLFADNIVLMCDTIKCLQQQLEILKKFRKDFKMIVNVIKAKVSVEGYVKEKNGIMTGRCWKQLICSTM